MSRVLLLDGDILVYKVSFACENQNSWRSVVITLKSMIRKYCNKSGCSSYIGLLTESSSNFRNKRATTLPYKGIRSEKVKPKWFSKVKAYCENSLNWQLMKGIEADDALVILAERMGNNRVTCGTIDKDLKQYPWESFFDLNKGTLFPIGPEEAHKNLWSQMITGDMLTDNIPGLSHAATYKNINPKFRGSTEFLWGPVRADALLSSVDPLDYAKAIMEEYIWAYDDHDIPEGLGEGYKCFGEYRYHETFDLLYMLRNLPEGVLLNDKTIAMKESKNEFKDIT